MLRLLRRLDNELASLDGGQIELNAEIAKRML